MKLVIFLALIAAAAAMGLILWFIGPPGQAKSQMDQLDTPEGQSGLKQRITPENAMSIPKDRPRTKDHVLVKILYPLADPRREQFGETVLSLRGNHVTYARRGVDSPIFDRIVMPLARVETLLAKLRALPEFPASRGGFIVDFVATDEKTRIQRELTLQEVENIQSSLEGSREFFVPDLLVITVEDTEPAEPRSARTWPADQALPKLDELREPRKIAGTDRLRRTLLEAKAKGDRFRVGNTDRRIRIARCEVVLP